MIKRCRVVAQSLSSIVRERAQKNAVIGGMSYRDTIDFISYYPETIEVDLIEERPKTIPGTKLDAYGKLTIIGTVDMLKYSQWLEKLWICHSLMIEFFGDNRAIEISAAIFRVEYQGCSKLDLNIRGY